jgi:acyl-CoA reductase-like NAD-dependent aldehyde dehydrogenase
LTWHALLRAGAILGDQENETMNLRARLRDPSLLVEGAYVGREWIAATSGAEITVVDPAETIATVPALGGRETRDAIRAAEVAWPAWKALPAAERARRLELWHDLMLANLEDLAVIMMMEQGKPLARGPRSDPIRRELREVVRRGCPARLRRRDPRPGSRPPHRRAEGAGRGLGGEHAVELPQPP